jgi:arylsulfatase A-like enzyme
MQLNSKAALALVLAIWANLATASDGDQIVLGGSDARPKTETTRPNIILILTDDQDLHMNSLDHTPLIHKRLIKEGTFYKRHFCTTAICCPSRASLWTGKLAHNTNVTDLEPPYGGFPIFVKNGHNENYLPVWLQDAGYNTFYTGKMFNAHSVWNYGNPHLKGWTGSVSETTG